MKTCTKCKELKPLDAFHRKAESRDGRTAQCAECANAGKRERWSKRQYERIDIKAYATCGFRSDSSSADADSIGNSGPEIQAYARW